jgi:hypothetical protein
MPPSQDILDRFTALAAELERQGYFADTISQIGPPTVDAAGAVDVHVLYRDGADPARVASCNAFIAGWTWVARRPRLLYDIYQSLGVLTAAQKQAIGNDLFGGSPPKFTQDKGPSAPSLLVLYTLIQTGNLSTGDKALVKQAAAAIYCLDNPRYLIAPAFDPSINVAGDEPVTTPGPV